MLPSETSKALSFPKSEKIKLKKQIEKLFRTGKAFQFGQLKFIWSLQALEEESDSLLKFGVSVPKKKLAKAHLRNTTKRRIREAFRLQKSNLFQHIPEAHQLLLFVIYTDNKIPEYHNLYNLIEKGIHKFQTELAKFTTT